MLENIDDLGSCEKILISSTDNLPDIRFLGEVNFSYADIEILSRLLKDKLNKDKENGISYLSSIPACVSFYLIGRGIINYRDGEFWPPIIEELGLTDSKTQYILGKIFLKYIQDHSLVNINIEDALSYVTPVLLHGGIPLSCFNEFYEKIVSYLLDRKLVEDNEISEEINRIRTIENYRNGLLNDRDRLVNQISILKDDIINLDNVILLSREREELLKVVADRNEWADLLEYDLFFKTKQLQQYTLNQRIINLLKIQAVYFENIRSFTPDDQKILYYRNEIEIMDQHFDNFRHAEKRIIDLQTITEEHEDELVSLATDLWVDEEGKMLGPRQGIGNEELQKVISMLRFLLACILVELLEDNSMPRDLGAFVVLIKERETLDIVITEGEAWVSCLKAIHSIYRECQRCKQELIVINKEMAEWVAALEQIEVALPTSIRLPENNPEKKIGEIIRCLAQAEERKNKSDAAKEVYEKEIMPALHVFASRRTQIEQEIATVEQRLEALGKGYLSKGIHILQEKKLALDELKKIETELKLHIDSQAQRQASWIEQELIQEIDCISRYIDALAWYQETRDRLCQNIEDLKRCIVLIKQRERLTEITADSASWIDLPNYYYFIADKRTELNEIDREAEFLKKRAVECLQQIELYTTNDCRLIDLTGIIAKLKQDLKLYQEQRDHQKVLIMKAKMCMREIETLTMELWCQKGMLGRANLNDLRELMIGLASFEQFDQTLDVWMENLKKLQTAHYEYKHIVSELSMLENVVKKWKINLQRITEPLLYPMVGTLDEIIAGLIERMKQAEKKRNVAEATKKDLMEKVMPELHDAEQCLARIMQEVDLVEQRIRGLGKGDLEEGKRVLAEKESVLLELAKIEKQLGQYTAETGLKENIQEYVLLKEEKSKELKIAQFELFQIDEQLDNHVTPLDYVDEPVQRFVIYGEEWLIKWLSACTALHRSHLGESIDFASFTASLPVRVIDELDKLMKHVIGEKEKIKARKGRPGLEGEAPKEERSKQKAIVERDKKTKEHFSCPQIVFDINQSELKMVIGGHSLHIYNSTNPPTIYARIISGEMPPAWIIEVPLHSYLVNGMVEIPEERIDIPHISNEYLVTQYIGNITRTWRVKLWDDKTYLIFNERGQKIEPDQLVEQRAWLIYPEGYEQFPENAVLSHSNINIDTNSYHLALINFVIEPVINLVSNDGYIYEIRTVTSESNFNPFLSSEEIVNGAWADGKRPIYTGMVPRLCVPSHNKEGINGWTIRIVKTLTDKKEEKIINGPH
jgi:hypothetical protein